MQDMDRRYKVPYAQFAYNTHPLDLPNIPIPYLFLQTIQIWHSPSIPIIPSDTPPRERLGKPMRPVQTNTEYDNEIKVN